MEFLTKLNNCSNVYNILELIRPEYHDDILKNFSILVHNWNNYDIRILLKSIQESNIFTKSEFKTILFEIINYLEKKGISSMCIINQFGCGLVYQKSDFQKLFTVIITAKIERQLTHIETKAKNINRKLYDAYLYQDKKKEKDLKGSMINLIAEFVKKWNLGITQEDLVELISWNCDSSRFEEFFVNNPLKYIKKQIEKIINNLIENNSIDNMEFIGSGSYSMVFKKDHIITKISLLGEQYSSYKCRSVLNFNNISTERLQNGVILYTIGTQDLANCNWYNSLTEEEINLKMYKTFCEARDDGYIIVDIKKENFGLVDNRLMVIDCSGFIYKESEVDVNNIDIPYTSKHIFEYFMKLYDEGYRIDKENKLSQSRT